MEMLGQRQLVANPQQVWDALNDPAVLKACIPGCDRFEATEANHYTVGTQLKIGPVAAKFTGKVALSDVEPPRSYTISFDGQGGAAGFGKGSSKVSLAPLPLAGGGEGTQLDYSVSAQVGGKIAQLGQRLIDGAAKLVADDFFKRFEAALMERHPELVGAVIATKDVALDDQNSPTYQQKNAGSQFSILLRNLPRDLSQPPYTYVAAALLGAALMALVLFFALA